MQSDLKAISDLIGDFSTDNVMAIYGPSQAGKTTIMLQTLYEISHKTERPSLLYDTEGGAADFLKSWEPIFKKKYPKGNVELRTKRSIMNILADHGKKLKMKLSGNEKSTEAAQMKTGGKMGLVVVADEFGDGNMHRLCRKKNYGAIYYDSITMPLKYFGGEQQNFPVRSHAINLWYNEMFNIQDEINAYIFAGHHATKNPTRPTKYEDMTGGSAIQYNSKIILYLKHAQPILKSPYRRMILMRHPSRAPKAMEKIMKLTDAGYVDYTKELMQNEIQP